MLCGCSVPYAWGAYYDLGRTGDSWEDAYVISSAEDLISLRSRVNSGSESSGKYYVLASDIDLTSQTGWYGIHGFKGHFDGQNHTVRMNSLSNSLFADIFELVNSDKDSIAIRNLNVTGSVQGDCAGTVVHYLYFGIVENCSFTGDMTPKDSASRFGAGGIVAHLEGGTVRNCRVSGNIGGASYAGGIAGEVLSGDIQYCTIEDKHNNHSFSDRRHCRQN